MITRSLDDFTQQEISEFIHKNTFLRNLHAESIEQLNILLSSGQVEVYGPDETIQDKGDNAKKFYVLLQGRLDVYTQSQDSPIGHVLAGQLVGALAVINHKPRSANLRVSRTEAVLLAIDFSLFGALTDFSKVQLQTKVCLYRAVVGFTFWKLDEYRYRNQSPFLVEGLSKHSEYTGEKNTIEELAYQAGSISYLGGLLESWNKMR